MARSVGHAYVVRPSSESAEIKQLARACMSEARSAGLSVTSVRAREHRLLEGSGARRADLIDPTDAAGLYRSLHVRPVAVLTLGEAFVRRDPSHDPPVKRHAIRLETFVAHKGYFGLVRPGVDLSRLLAEFLRWSSEVNCAGEHDPRILPLHAFETSEDWSRLGSVATDRAFAKAYGPASARRDDRGNAWRKAHALHGRELLTIAGFTLTAGMHWDVAPDGRQTRICTSDAVWKLKGHDAYLNVYPDGRTRRPSIQTVRRVWRPSS